MCDPDGCGRLNRRLLMSIRVLDLAPHASLPPMDGADKRAWHLYEGMVRLGAGGTLVARTQLIEGLGAPQAHSPRHCWRDRKLVAALAAWLGGRDYRQLKHLLPGARRAVAEAAMAPYDAVMVCFLFSMPLARPALSRSIRLVVDTHNYDANWYGSMAATTTNPVLRRVCRNGIRHSEQALRRLPQGTVLVHVSETDSAQYRKHRPDLDHVVVENGTTVRPRASGPDYTAKGKKTVMFVGSLSAKINQDALRYFAARFWPVLRHSAVFRVAGSNAPASVTSLCAEQGWTLYSNVGQEELERLYHQAHFAALPFEYGAGSKLKFLEACGRGVPVLATQAGLCGVAAPPRLAAPSDDPAEWARRVQTPVEPDPQLIRELVSFAEQFSWKNLSERLLEIIKGAPLVNASSYRY